MSRHIIEDGRYRWALGWDHPLQSFYLQKYKKSHRHGQPFMWFGAGSQARLYEVDDLVRVANGVNLVIPYELLVTLYADKDEGR